MDNKNVILILLVVIIILIGMISFTLLTSIRKLIPIMFLPPFQMKR